MIRFLVACLLALLMPLAGANEAAPLAANPELEARVMRLAEELRCLVCQNQTIADSNAGLAVDLKQQIREQLTAGRTDAEVLAYMVERYGDFVLYRPPVKSTTLALWYGPLALLALGVLAAVLAVRRHRPRPELSHHTDAQRQRAADLLADEPEIRT